MNPVSYQELSFVSVDARRIHDSEHSTAVASRLSGVPVTGAEPGWSYW